MSEPNSVTIKASCENCRNKVVENERYYCVEKAGYLTSLFWNPVCICFAPTKEIMEKAIKNGKFLEGEL